MHWCAPKGVCRAGESHDGDNDGGDDDDDDDVQIRVSVWCLQIAYLLTTGRAPFACLPHKPANQLTGHKNKQTNKYEHFM